jgi:protein-tyrosine-phosphatase
MESVNKMKRNIHLLFVCTHNARRSQAAELLSRSAASYYGLRDIETYSAGTTPTAFHLNMVDALARTGMSVDILNWSKNPIYHLGIEEGLEARDMFSKDINHQSLDVHPKIATMVCSKADEACPSVPGAFDRISLPYRDPKSGDEQSNVGSVYDKTVNTIAREMYYLMRQYMKNTGKR